MNRIEKKHVLIVWISLVVFAMTSLILLQNHTFEEYNEIKVYKSSQLLIAETEKIIAGNDEDRLALNQFLREIYMEKAKTAAYILDLNEDMERNHAKLKDLAADLGVDQIHIFDELGTIYSGTDPEFYGLNLDSGEQIRFFKPMLMDKTRVMSQNIVPNTAEGRSMLYAMCWNKAGTKMIQVGACGERFPSIIHKDRIDEFMELIPRSPGTDIILTGGEDTVIAASTNPSFIGKDLLDLGIDLDGRTCMHLEEFLTGTKENPIYCSAKTNRGYRILIAQYKNVVDENIPITLFTFTEYLILVFIAMTFVVDFYYDRFIQEKAHAMKDKLTGLNSRRAYEMALADLDDRNLNDSLVFVSMDVNGLKVTNDSLGHQAGDTLLQGAADCMTECFTPYGEVYRFGGDEFAAIILAKDIEIQPMREHMKELCLKWSEKNNIPLSVSVGFAISCDHPGASIRNLESIADQNMYDDKSRYYSSEKNDRRGASNESK